MEFDLALVSMPAFTQKCPSLGLASLAAYLKEKQVEAYCYDYGIRFFKKDLTKYKIKSPLIKQLNLSLYPLWGASNWLGFENIIDPELGQNVIQSLCPVCSKLYQPIFDEFLAQNHLTQQILSSYAEELASLDTRVYAFSLLLGNASASLYIIRKIKELKPDSTIIVGGPEASSHYRASFYSQFDDIDFTVYHSEGEIPLERILSYLKGEISKPNIPGVYIKTQKNMLKTNPPALLDLNELPIPKYEMVKTGYDIHQLKSLDILISKGCHYNCTFCNEQLIWGSYRPKNIKRIVEELQFYVENYGISEFELGDNSFSSSPSFVKALENLSSIGIHLQWSGNCKVNELNRQKLIKYHQLGLSQCYFGIESASPKVLKLMKKQIDISQTSDLLNICSQNQIKPVLYLMVGFPGETAQEFQKTLNFIETHKANIYDILTSVFTLQPNSQIFQSDLLIPIQIGPKYLSTFTYQTKDGVTHEERKARLLKIHQLWDKIKELQN